MNVETNYLLISRNFLVNVSKWTRRGNSPKQFDLHLRPITPSLQRVRTNIEQYPFLAKTGEIGQLILQHDWSKTSIGEIEDWPVSLRITLYNVLHSGFPMFLFWGEEFLCFYNEAFRPSLGIDGRHPAIGKKAIVVWGEIWHIIGPLLQKVFVTGEAVMFEDRLVPFHRNGKVEDIYWTFTYSPALGEDDKISGVLVTCIETTKSVLARMETEHL